MADDKDCYELMADAMKVMEDMEQYDNGDFDFWLPEIRGAIEDTVSDVKAGKPLPGDFLRQWDFTVVDSLDHMLSQRLSGMPRKANGEPNFKKWDEDDVALYNLFDKLTAIVQTLVVTCKPENESRITASRVAKGLPNVATRKARNDAAKAERNGKREVERRANAERVAIARAHLDKVLADRDAADAARNAASKAATNLQMGELFSVKQMVENPSLHDIDVQNYNDEVEFFNQPGRWFVRTQNGKSKIVFVEHGDNDLGWVVYRSYPYDNISFRQDTLASSSGITYALMNPSNLDKVVAIAVESAENNNNNNNSSQNGGKRSYRCNTRRKITKNRHNRHNSRKNCSSRNRRH